jgi:hypothetical protein
MFADSLEKKLNRSWANNTVSIIKLSVIFTLIFIIWPRPVIGVFIIIKFISGGVVSTVNV